MKNKSNLAVVIAAAGLSKRMGQYKSRLQLDRQSFLEKLIGVYQNCDFKHCLVTLPDLSLRHEVETCKQMNASFSLNLFPERGLLGSIQTAVLCYPEVDALFVNPIDAPCTNKETIEKMAIMAKKKGICIASFNSRHGHPISFTSHFFPSLLQLDGNSQGAYALVEQNPDLVFEIEASASVLLNINHPSDYQALFATKPSERIGEAAAMDAPLEKFA